MGLFSKLFSKKEQNQPAPEKRTVMNMKVGDIVTYEFHDFEVVGKLTLRDGSYEWYDYQLLGEEGTLWLSVEMDDELELAIYQKVKLQVSKPYPKKLTYDNKTYYLEEEGVARVTGEGRSKNVHGMETHYADYEDDSEESYLGLESWDTEVEVSTGYAIEPYELKIIAGSN
ncbi:DUF4178 domain-containing protein [Oceanobacillus chungangensis]|uniref:DUF4178 domain-containing protein n=1 Tax=Oceanobacillus chungangensis TaxID=1229152 RepID=A0A3D8PZF6_9BACI|nr:DUF4178 domain-containing protein [Oceanobacillus chungangensis]RDW21556.1 DUF4178 domain-containing protein [Oceanobacillus chungangensis]